MVGANPPRLEASPNGAVAGIRAGLKDGSAPSWRRRERGMPEEFVTQRLGRTCGGRWRLERVLGMGGMGAVYAARDTSGALVAVKILHPEMCLRAEIRERFQREGYAANRVSHPGAVRVLEHGPTEDHSAYLVMELLEGEPLSERIKRLGAL